jgi:putative ABC transport system permease protein
MPYEEVAKAFDLYGAFNAVTLTLAPGAGERPVIAALDRLLEPYGGRGRVRAEGSPVPHSRER